MPGSSDIPPPPPQRTRTKAPDFTELFRSAHGSRHSSRTGAGTGSGPSSSTSSPGEKPAGSKAPSRRSMLPFLGRKKFVEQPEASSTPTLVKSPLTPVNTVRRSFGNGHAVLMITPTSSVPPVVPPLPSKLPSTDVPPPSFGSKLAAHFTPLRSPNGNPKARYSARQKPALPSPAPSPTTTLLPPLPGPRAPSIESHHSSMRSRSTTPRPLRGIPSSAIDNGDEEDFSDLFTRPDPLRKLHPSLNSPSSTSVHIYLRDSPKKSGELTPTSPLTPSGPPLHFPIPPSTVVPPRSILAEKSLPRSSIEFVSLSSQGSRSPSKLPSLKQGDIGSGRSRTLHSDISSSQDERNSSRPRATSVSGSDTDTSKANDSAYSSSGVKLAHVKPSSMKPRPMVSNATKTSSGPPPSFPLPSPPLSTSSGSSGPRSAPNNSPKRVAFPRPRANTLSVTSNLAVPTHPFSKFHPASPVTRLNRVNSDAASGITIDELRETLSEQCKKNAQLQEYIVSITKRYEDDRMAMSRTIEKLERNVRKKMREIEGLRWLVIHNGAVSDIDAAANLARASFSTQEGDTFDGARRISYISSSPMASPRYNGPLSHPPAYGQQGPNTNGTAMSTPSDIRSETSCSLASMSISSASETTSLTAASLSIIPERIDGITRAERQRIKEERRASKALRRISAASSFALSTDPLTHSSSSVAEDPTDPNFDPKQSMDEVLEKLEPFRHS